MKKTLGMFAVLPIILLFSLILMTPDTAQASEHEVVQLPEAGEISPGNLFPDVGFGSIVKFEVVNHELIATVAAQISPAGFIGHVRITYELYKNRIYQAKSIEFIPEVR